MCILMGGVDPALGHGSISMIARINSAGKAFQLPRWKWHSEVAVILMIFRFTRYFSARHLGEM